MHFTDIPPLLPPLDLEDSVQPLHSLSWLCNCHWYKHECDIPFRKNPLSNKPGTYREDSAKGHCREGAVKGHHCYLRGILRACAFSEGPCGWVWTGFYFLTNSLIVDVLRLTALPDFLLTLQWGPCSNVFGQEDMLWPTGSCLIHSCWHGWQCSTCSRGQDEQREVGVICVYGNQHQGLDSKQGWLRCRWLLPFREKENRLGDVYCQAFSYKTQKQILPGSNWEEMNKELSVNPQDLLEEE